MPDEAWHVSPKQLLQQRDLVARKRFGQNFLVEPRVAERIAALIPAGACVIEIGGGTGTLTAALQPRAVQLVVLEIDRDLAALLRERFAGAANVSILNQDALEFGLGETLGSWPPARAIVGNLPYYITTPLLERILACAGRWESAVLMVQREYARRLCAKPGSADYGSLTLFAQYFSSVRRAFDVGAAGFYPAPRVASSVVVLTPRRADRETVRSEKLLLQLIRAAFAQRRKTLTNSVQAAFDAQRSDRRSDLAVALKSAGLDPMIRAERLSLVDFMKLSDRLFEAGWRPQAHPTET